MSILGYQHSSLKFIFFFKKLGLVFESPSQAEEAGPIMPTFGLQPHGLVSHVVPRPCGRGRGCGLLAVHGRSILVSGSSGSRSCTGNTKQSCHESCSDAIIIFFAFCRLIIRAASIRPLRHRCKLVWPRHIPIIILIIIVRLTNQRLQRQRWIHIRHHLHHC
jgi:hypothetical protein